VIWQCQRCGALADPIYGTGAESYCPSCQAAGTVMGEDGKIPAPALYDAWRRKQQAAAAHGVGNTEAIRRLPQPARRSRLLSVNPRQGDDDMRSKKLHSGLYHCPECLYEVTLTAEASLQCEDCKGRLYEGELPEESEDDDDYDEGDE